MDLTAKYTFLLKYRLLLFLIFLFFIPLAHSENIENNDNKKNSTSNQNGKNNSQPENNIFPSYQEVFPLISFGQTIVDKNDVILFLYGVDQAGKHKSYIDTKPALIYGISDKLSFLLSAPVAISFNEEHFHSSGLEDIYLQLEYAFYSKENSSHSDQATVVGGVTLPTGSPNKLPPTGLGSPSYFLGTTFGRSYKKWSVFASPGVLFRTTYHGTKPGDQYLYQCGTSAELCYKKPWKIVGTLELDGLYTKKTTEEGVADPNSGGNVILLTPSLSAYSEKFIFQFGVGFPIVQHLNGVQNKDYYLLVGDIAYIF